MNKIKKIFKFFISFDNLRTRFSAIAIITLCILISFFTFLQFEYLDNLYVLIKKTDIFEAADLIDEIDLNSEDSGELMSSLESTYNIYVEIYNPRDTLIYTTQNNDAMFGNYLDPELDKTNDELSPRVMRICEHIDNIDGSYFEIREEFYGSAQYLVHTSFPSDDKVVEIYTSIDVLRYTANTASWALFAITVLILLIVISMTLFYAVMFTRPIWQISNATKKITNMDFSVNCPSFKVKDLNELSSNINVLAISLNRALEDLKVKNEKLELEIETERKVDKTRRSFIANASHELKTPIAIIQGYTEGIKLGIGDNVETYCDTILDESEKMNNLVVRLLELARYDAEGYKLKKTSFNINDEVSKNISSRIKIMNEKGINFSCDIDPTFVAYADVDLMKDVFNNYISNACSHICNEMNLIVSCKSVDNIFRLSVFNSGKPISEHDIDNIWQSFYRADKAHSRSEGRFGLGLSIVSSVQEMHGQKYGVINHDNGVEFWFDVEKVTFD